MVADKVAHLQMIQDVVARLAQNSFHIKGWSVTLVSALFALAAVDANHVFAILAYLPVFVFWYLDAYFLRQERLFRHLFDSVREASDTVDFSMNTENFEKSEKRATAIMFSKSLRLFHGSLAAATVAIMIVLMVSH